MWRSRDMRNQRKLTRENRGKENWERRTNPEPTPRALCGESPPRSGRGFFMRRSYLCQWGSACKRETAINLGDCACHTVAHTLMEVNRRRVQSISRNEWMWQLRRSQMHKKTIPYASKMSPARGRSKARKQSMEDHWFQRRSRSGIS
jgi:hypothetical protein